MESPIIAIFQQYKKCFLIADDLVLESNSIKSNQNKVKKFVIYVSFLETFKY